MSNWKRTLKINNLAHIVNIKEMKKLIYVLLFILAANQAKAQRNVRILWADAFFNNNKYEQALLLYNIELGMKEKWSYHYCLYKCGECKYNLNRLEEAQKDLRAAMEISPKYLNYTFIMGASNWTLGRTYSKQRDFKKAVEFLNEATKYFPKNAALYSTIGYEEIQLGNYDDALTHLEKAIELGDDYAYAYNNRALIYIQMKEFEKAEKDIETSMQLDRKNPYVYKHRALLNIAKGDLTTVCEDLNKAKELKYESFNQFDKEEVNELLMKYCQ